MELLSENETLNTALFSLQVSLLKIIHAHCFLYLILGMVSFFLEYFSLEVRVESFSSKTQNRHIRSLKRIEQYRFSTRRKPNVLV